MATNAHNSLGDFEALPLKKKKKKIQAYRINFFPYPSVLFHTVAYSDADFVESPCAAAKSHSVASMLLLLCLYQAQIHSAC